LPNPAMARATPRSTFGKLARATPRKWPGLKALLTPVQFANSTLARK